MAEQGIKLIPKSLKTVSIILMVLGGIRTVVGMIALINLPEVSPTPIILDNLVAGALILFSGVLLNKGLSFGRILLIFAVLIAIGTSFFVEGGSFTGTFVIFGTLIGVLFFEKSVKQYFSGLDQKQKRTY